MSKLRIKLLLTLFFISSIHLFAKETNSFNFFTKNFTQLKLQIQENLKGASPAIAEYIAPACTNDSELAGWYFNGSNYTGAMGNGDAGIAPDLTNACVTVSNLNRRTGKNSTTDGHSGKAICVGAFGVNNTWVDDDDRAIQFTVTFPNNRSGRLSKIDFYQQSPLSNLWYPEVTTVCNNPAQKFGIRVLKDGVEIYKNIDLATGSNWEFESFDFSGDVNFEYTNGAVFQFELLAYDKNDLNCWNSIINTEPVMWDLDDVKFLAVVLPLKFAATG